MAGILFLLISFFFGILLVYTIIPENNRLFFSIAPRKATLAHIPQTFFVIPAGIVMGLLTNTVLTYFFAYLSVLNKSSYASPIQSAALISCLIHLFIGIILLHRYLLKTAPLYAAIEEAGKGDSTDSAARSKRRRKRTNDSSAPDDNPQEDRRIYRAIPRYNPTPFSIIFYTAAILLFFFTVIYLFYYGFFRSGDRYFAGQTVFSDLSPHTALIASFSRGENFPTQYPHFPGDGIRYHFLFFFLCGILHSLGFTLDHALNVPSVIAALSCLVLLGTLAVLIIGKRLTFLLSGLFVLFRHNLSFIPLFAEKIRENNGNLTAAVTGLWSTSEWFGNTKHDDWGLWAVNVFANQRHLLFGVALILILLFFFLPYTRRMLLSLSRERELRSKVKTFFTARDSWLPGKGDPIRPWRLLLPAILIVLFMPFFHGSALIAGLLILFVLAIFSKARILFLITAICAVVSAFFQTAFFSGGAASVISFSVKPGFLAEGSDFFSVFSYLLGVFGLLIPLLLVIFIQIKGAYRRIIMAAFILPCVFAFLFQISVELSANHKFLQISLILFQIFIAGAIVFLLSPFSFNARGATISSKAKPSQRRLVRIITICSRTLAGILLCALTMNGIIEWRVYRNMNHTSFATMRTDSPVTEWIAENTMPRRVFLTAAFAMDSFFLSGRFAYYGHPYYAFSAGSNTESRLEIYEFLLTGADGDYKEFLRLCHQENIHYVLMNNALRFQDFALNEEFFRENLFPVAVFPEEGNTVIYLIPSP